MIDTHKYENITPDRWTVDEEDPYRVVDAQECTIARTDFVDIDEEREWQLANAQLIADAPLFLAEVKRLREDNPNFIVEQWIDEYISSEELYVKLMAIRKFIDATIELAFDWEVEHGGEEE